MVYSQETLNLSPFMAIYGCRAKNKTFKTVWNFKENPNLATKSKRKMMN